MGIAASELSKYVIRPTLLYLGRPSAAAEALLLGTAATQSALGEALHQRQGYGLYGIGAASHLQLWDRYLARNPDLASHVRGLASQQAFLIAPHLELTVNLRYATAIAWLLVESQPLPLPGADDLPGLARIWCRVFRPEGKPQEFVNAWHCCIDDFSQAA
ncbi:hypothetical protein AvCA_33010 [Azotobacter vinelandii CA]|uniref:Uncharacterized protein n=3 Tax=Azotobacter group TaxID=351 RepID=C1DPN5_AZOVD|nr:hypothetical protein [Azotobacter vinelandii]ACO79456.1 conserved hypothetical protein [Azotobacter vinelandii DJ]AGK14676.1 hypothetical protein AvCA_33010 [Azotobacter vinelandii CA]AGK21242.1 hypothetical protein AvCA6_33010 [Azotobacter vinelandii CA6]WKN20356.1 hypothetical protein AVAEIV_003314 [Azotobacter vinelandii]SFX88404.1 hypothetical protein SAMN04244547_03095 [Azotobacter vinelandii]